jgi:polar amino acid transport system permease protein
MLDNNVWLTSAIEWMPALMQGAVVTLQISVGAFVIGLLIGLVVALIKLKAGPVGVRLANSYTTICRSVPELLLILLLYYAGSDLINKITESMGYENFDINGFMVAVIVLGIVQGAYIAEILRGAILAVPFGQIEAARALAMPAHLYTRRIILPAMMPYAIGGLSNLWLILIKDSALISVVGYSELLFTAKQAAGTTKHYFVFYVLAGALYLIFTLLSSLVFKWFENRLSRWLPQTSTQ